MNFRIFILFLFPLPILNCSLEAQIKPMVSQYRTADTIYMTQVEKIEVDTSYNIVPVTKKSKISSIDYTIYSIKNYNFLLSEFYANMKGKKEEYSDDEDYVDGTLWGIPFKKFGIYKDNGFFRIFINLEDQKKQAYIYNKLNEIVFGTSLKNSGIDTIQFSARENNAYEFDIDSAGNINKVAVPDSLLNDTQAKDRYYEIERFGIGDNFFQLQDIYTKSNLPLGKISTLYFIINESGKVHNCYYTTENTETKNYIDKGIFKEIKYPVLNVNGTFQPYIVITDHDHFETPLYNRFLKDFEKKKNIYPVFSEKDSLFLYHSTLDNQYFLYTNLNYYKDRKKYLTCFPDTTEVNKMYFDFNKDGLTDFIFPLYEQLFNKVRKVIYGGSDKDNRGLYTPKVYYNLMYSKDSNYFSSYEKHFDYEYRKSTLYSFAPAGDSVLLQCTYYTIYTSFMDQEEIDSYVIKLKGKPYGKVYNFVNNLDKELTQKRYNITKLHKAKREYKKIKKMIVYYREHPEKIMK